MQAAEPSAAEEKKRPKSTGVKRQQALQFMTLFQRSAKLKWMININATTTRSLTVSFSRASQVQKHVLQNLAGPTGVVNI